MKSSAVTKILIEETNNLSEEQKLFNKLVKQIERKKKELNKWERCAEDYKHKYHKGLSPIEDELNKYRNEFVYILDNAYSNKNFSKKEKKLIVTLIHDMCAESLSLTYDENLANIFTTYQAIVKEDQKKRAGSFYDDIVQRIEDDMKERMHDERKEWKSSRIDDEENYCQPQETEEDKASQQSLKEIYRSLAANLHPDKELDELEKDRKNSFMQDINKAYKEKNLVELLKIQLEEEKNQQKNIEEISKGKVGSFNKAFKRQLEELRDNVSAIKRSFQLYHPDLKMSGLTENKLNDKLQENIKYHRKVASQTKNDLEKYKKDIKNIKVFLKSVESRSAFEEMFLY